MRDISFIRFLSIYTNLNMVLPPILNSGKMYFTWEIEKNEFSL